MMTLQYFLDLKSLCKVNINQINNYFSESSKILYESNLRDSNDKQFVEERFVRNDDNVICEFNHKSKKPLYDVIFSQPNSEITNRLIPSILNRFIQLGDGEINNINYGENDSNAGVLHPNAKLTTEINPNRLWHIAKLCEYKCFREYHIKEDILSRNCDQNTLSVYMPKIVFTTKSFKSFRNLSHDDKETVLRDLIKLNEYVSKKWLHGNFQVLNFSSSTGVDASDESETTKNDSMLNRHRYFSIPNIGSQYCFLHIKISNTYRIHFYPDAQNRKIYIAYIGAHLPTAQNR